MQVSKYVQDNNIIIKIEISGLIESDLQSLSFLLLTMLPYTTQLVIAKKGITYNVRLISTYLKTPTPESSLDLSKIINLKNFIDLIEQFYMRVMISKIELQTKNPNKNYIISVR